MKEFRYSVCVRVVFALLFALLAFPNTSRGQSLNTTANLAGTVTDSTGAVVSGATVVVSGADNGVSRTVKTNASGSYSFSLLPPAKYKLKIALKGFKTYEQNGITLISDQTANQDVQLTIGAETDQVEVTSEAPLLNTSDANLSAEITAKQVEDLPLNLRNVISLATLNSSVSNTSESQQLGEGGTSGKADQDVSFLNFGGGFFGTSGFLLDGIWDTDSTWGAVIYVPSVEAVSSFKIQTNSFTAQNGFSTGNVINVQTKSGTNQFHGDVFEFIRNSDLDANNFFNNHNGSPRQNFQRNQFGFSAGGPVFVPGVYNGRDKAFVFGSYEGLRQGSPVNGTFTVPTAAMRTGDFSALLTGTLVTQSVNGVTSNVTDALGNTVQVNQLYDATTGRSLTNGSVDAKTGKMVTCPAPTGSTTPAATCYYRDPYANNSVTGAINPVGANLIKFYPAPTNAALSNNYFATASAPTTSDEYIIRGDYNLTDATRIYFRFADKHEQKTNSPTYYGANDPGGPGNIRPNNRYSIATGFSHFFKDGIGLSANAGFHRWNQGGLYQGYPFDQSTLGLPASLNAGSNEFPEIFVNNGSSLGPVQGGFGAGIANVGSVGADVTKTLKRHDLSFGFIDAVLQNNGTGPANTSFNFGNDYTSQFQGTGTIGGAGYGFATLLVGLPDSGSTANAFHTAPERHYIGFYGQDNFKFSKTLTLNLGLRYELQPPFTERHNRQAYFDYSAINPISSAVGIQLPGEEVYSNSSHRGMQSLNLTNFAPRIGFTYQFDRRTVVRGGYGVFFPPSSFVGIQSSPGFSQSTNYDASDDSGLTLKTNLSNPFPTGLLAPTGNALGPLTDVGNGASTGANYHRNSPLVQQYSLGVEYALSTNDVITASYVGNRGTHILTNYVGRSQLYPSLATAANAAFLMDQVPNPFYGVITSSSCGLNNPTIERIHLLSPYPQYCSVSESQATEGDSYYNALLIDYNHRFHGGLNVLVSYTYSKFLDDTGGTADWAYRGSSNGYRNTYDLKFDKSVDGTDQPNSLVVNYIYALPVGKGMKYAGDSGRITNAVIGGWQVSGITTIKSGLPLSFRGNGSANFFSGQHAQQVGDPHLANRGINEWFNTAAFVDPAQYTYGNTARYLSFVRSPGYDNWDASLQKVWQLHDQINLQFRSEFYNLPNHANFFTPDTGVDDGGYGKITQAFDARSIQFAAKIVW